MFPGMVYAILSRDPDFVENLSVLLRAAGGEVYAASSWDECARIQQEGGGGDVRGGPGVQGRMRKRREPIDPRLPSSRAAGVNTPCFPGFQ